MSEERNISKSAENSAAMPAKKFAQVFCVPNVLNLVAVVCMVVMLIMMLVMPIHRVGADENAQFEGYTGENEITYSGLELITDIINEFDIEKDEGAFVVPENPGSFSNAVTLLAYQATFDYAQALEAYQAEVDAGNTDAQRPEEPAELKSRLGMVIITAVPAVMSMVVFVIMTLVALIKAVKRCFVCKPYPKMSDNFVTSLLCPAAMVVITLLMRYGFSFIRYVHFVESNLLMMLVLWVAILVLDIICYTMAKRLSKTHYAYQA